MLIFVFIYKYIYTIILGGFRRVPLKKETVNCESVNDRLMEAPSVLCPSTPIIAYTEKSAVITTTDSQNKLLKN